MTKSSKKYVICTYIGFWAFIGFIGMLMNVLKMERLSAALQIVCAWTPTFVIVCLFRSIYPGEHFGSFIKRQFSEKISLRIVFYAVAIQLLIFTATIMFICFTKKIPILDQIVTSPATLAFIFIDNIIRGPLGEELGWRGFLLNDLQKTYSPFKSSIIIAVIWGFWHLPLWLMTGFTGLQLIQYSICFMIMVFSFSIMITIFYNKNKNLLLPMLIHQMINFFIGIQSSEMLYRITVTCGFYVLVVSIMILFSDKKSLFKRIV